jgi:uncharacterized membrane protein (UPF0127 family)
MAHLYKLNNVLRTRKGRIITIVILLIATLVFVMGIAVERASAPHDDSGVCVPESLQPGDDACIFLEYARTPVELERGLGNRDSLSADKGMLFVFPDQQVRCFWMKEMLIDIDIVWLDAGRKIVAKELDVSPDTYPQNFCPGAPAKYVIEVNADQARDWPIGSTVPF